MQNEWEKFKGTIVSHQTVFQGSNDGVFPLRNPNQDWYGDATVFQWNEENNPKSDSNSKIGQSTKDFNKASNVGQHNDAA